MKLKLLIILFFLASTIAHANITLPAIFSDHMVLQQNSTVTIWGWGKTPRKGRNYYWLGARKET